MDVPEQPDDYGLVTQPTVWVVGRQGGYNRSAGTGQSLVHMAEVVRLDTGLFVVTSGMNDVKGALMELGLWDGSGGQGGPVVGSFDAAVDLARRAIEYSLDMHWSKQDTRAAVLRRHQPKDRT